jgi:NADP-dependent 3-hydroxy acid dehydrogenase YdfG
MSELLVSKTVFITGASRGIGATIAEGFAEQGANVVVTDIARQKGELDAVAAKITAMGRKCLSIVLDVTQKTQVESVVAEATDHMGQIDILVNNAGILVPTKLQDLDEASWDAHFDVNAKGVLWLRTPSCRKCKIAKQDALSTLPLLRAAKVCRRKATMQRQKQPQSPLRAFIRKKSVWMASR